MLFAIIGLGAGFVLSVGLVYMAGYLLHLSDTWVFFIAVVLGGTLPYLGFMIGCGLTN